jgi:23S rRNA pseudouridine1911/1915/1917 synthase
MIVDIKYTVSNEDTGKTVKSILKCKLQLSERLLRKLKYEDKIRLNRIPVHVNVQVKAGDLVEAFVDLEETAEDMTPEDIPIDILYEDDCLIAVNKQPNIVVHPTSYHPSGTVANAILYHLLKQGVVKKVRPVSRLDRDTSGILLFAKNPFVQEFLVRQMQDKTFHKEYIGIVHGHLSSEAGVINLPIERKPGSIMLRHVTETGAPSVTHYTLIERLREADYLQFRLETGRTHQIRVHCQAIGHPLIGETLYSDRISELIGRQALHSIKTSFIHPLSRQEMTLTAPIPADMANLVEILRK